MITLYYAVYILDSYRNNKITNIYNYLDMIYKKALMELNIFQHTMFIKTTTVDLETSQTVLKVSLNEW